MRQICRQGEEKQAMVGGTGKRRRSLGYLKKTRRERGSVARHR